jgi:UV DNA damage endonuclease
MARKAKADLSAAQPDIAALETSDLPNRRSSRRKSNKPVYTEDDPGLAVEDTLPIDGGRPAGTVRRGLMEQGNSPANRAALKRALDGVGELDAELIRQTKRQKKLVAQSGIATDLDTVTEAGAGAGTPPSGGQRAPKVKKQPRAKKAVTRDISGGEEEDDGDDAYVASDGDPVDELDAPQDAAERGAARPPAVNSSYLPLPWKGRLGYVSPRNPTTCGGTSRC